MPVLQKDEVRVLKPFRSAWMLSLLFAFVLMSSAPLGASVDVEVSLEPEHTGVPVPVSVDVSRWIASEGGRSSEWRLQEVPGNREVPFQIDRAAERLEFIVDVPQSSRPTKKRFRFSKGKAPASAGFKIENAGGKHLVVSEGNRPVLAYNYGMMLPQGVSARWRRSCYIHPIYGLSGETLTDDFPADHLHHRGLATMWAHVMVGDRKYDLWHLKGIKPRFRRLVKQQSGPVSALFQVASGWYTDEGKNVLEETWTIKVLRAGERGRIVEVEILMDPTETPVTIGSSGTGYSGLALRFSPRKETVLTGPAGRLPEDVNKKRFLWNDLSGKFGGLGKISGVAIFDYPENPRHPSFWSSRYYGFLNPSPTSLETLSIPQDKPLRLRYRLWIHKGDATSGNVAQAYRVFTQPPKVRVLPNSTDKM